MDRILSTLPGACTPTVLEILGVIMDLRLGWLVGHLGVGCVLPIVLIANAITIITTPSLSAVATNVQVGAGGACHIISRSPGIGIGAAIGLPPFLPQGFSVTPSAFGLAKSPRFIWPQLPLPSFALVIAVAGPDCLGAEQALTAQGPKPLPRSNVKRSGHLAASPPRPVDAVHTCT